MGIPLEGRRASGLHRACAGTLHEGQFWAKFGELLTLHPACGDEMIEGSVREARCVYRGSGFRVTSTAGLRRVS